MNLKKQILSYFTFTVTGIAAAGLLSLISAPARAQQAAVAIDARTHRTAGDAAARFERHRRVRIRGRAEPVDIYALPIATA